MRSLCIVVTLHVAVNSIKPFGIAMETHNCVPFAPLSSYKILRTAVDNIKVLMSSCTVLDTLVRY
jgi:hypothetical protein